MHIFSHRTIQTFSKYSIITSPSLFTGLKCHQDHRWKEGRNWSTLLTEDAETHLEVRLGKAPCNSNHGGGQWARDTNGGQELRYVGREAERDWTVGI